MAATSLPQLLRYEDRNSMASSLESRLPFLTPDLADFLLRLPADFLLGRDGTTKNVFRQAMARYCARSRSRPPRQDRLRHARATLVEGVTALGRGNLGEHAGTQHRRPRRTADARRLAGNARRADPLRFPHLCWVNLIRWAERFDVQFGE